MIDHSITSSPYHRFFGQARVLPERDSMYYDIGCLVLQVVDGLVAEYEVSATGSFKWQKLVKFLQKR